MKQAHLEKFRKFGQHVLTSYDHKIWMFGGNDGDKAQNDFYYCRVSSKE